MILFQPIHSFGLPENNVYSLFFKNRIKESRKYIVWFRKQNHFTQSRVITRKSCLMSGSCSRTNTSQKRGRHESNLMATRDKHETTWGTSSRNDVLLVACSDRTWAKHNANMRWKRYQRLENTRSFTFTWDFTHVYVTPTWLMFTWRWHHSCLLKTRGLSEAH